MDFALVILVKLVVSYLLLCVGDFGLQTKFLADGKAVSKEILFYHAVTANAPIVILWAIPNMHLTVLPGVEIAVSFHLTTLALVIRIASHAFIDWLKAQRGLIKSIWGDQLYHVAVDFALIVTGLI